MTQVGTVRGDAWNFNGLGACLEVPEAISREPAPPGAGGQRTAPSPHQRLLRLLSVPPPERPPPAALDAQPGGYENE